MVSAVLVFVLALVLVLALAVDAVDAWLAGFRSVMSNRSLGLGIW